MTAEDESDFLAENGLAELPERKRGGRPRRVQPQTFAEALAALPVDKAQIVKALVAGAPQARAYQSVHPTANATTAAANCRRLLDNNPTMRAAVKLGRAEMAVQLIEDTKYDLRAAHAEVCHRIAEAARRGNDNAIASMLREKFKLHGLIEQRDNVTAQAGFVFKIEGLPDQSRVIEATTTAPALETSHGDR